MKFNIVIDHAVEAPGHGKDVVDGLNAIDKAHLNKMMFRIDLLQDRTSESNLHTSNARDKREENAKYKVRHYNVQDKKM
eukprot:5640681-Ditylum_brightwellii.AAC.1